MLICSNGAACSCNIFLLHDSLFLLTEVGSMQSDRFRDVTHPHAPLTINRAWVVKTTNINMVHLMHLSLGLYLLFSYPSPMWKTPFVVYTC